MRCCTIALDTAKSTSLARVGCEITYQKKGHTNFMRGIILSSFYWRIRCCQKLHPDDHLNIFCNCVFVLRRSIDKTELFLTRSLLSKSVSVPTKQLVPTLRRCPGQVTLDKPNEHSQYIGDFLPQFTISISIRISNPNSNSTQFFHILCVQAVSSCNIPPCAF